MLDQHRLVRGVCAFTDRAHAVKRGNFERGSEVAVGSSAGGGLVERETQIASERLRVPEELNRPGASLHRRPIHAAGYRD